MLKKTLEAFQELSNAAAAMALPTDAVCAVNTEFTSIYLSGKISGLHPEDARQNFLFAERELRTYHQTDNIINPFRIRPFLGIKSWLFYMISDIREQSTCTHSAFMYNWLESRGAVIEYFFARFIFKHHIIFLPS